MSSRKNTTLLVKEETTNLRRSSRGHGSIVEQPRKIPTRRCKKRKNLAAKHQPQLPEPPLITAGHEMSPGETWDGIPAVELPSLPEEKKLMGHKMLFKEKRDGVPTGELPFLLEQEKSTGSVLALGETMDGVPAVELPSFPEQEKSMGRVVPPGKTREGPAVKLPLPEQEKSMGHEMPPGETMDGVPKVELPSLLEQEKPMGNKMSMGETRAAGPVVEIPSSPQEEKPKIDLLFLLEKSRKPHFQKDDSLKLREHLLNAASVLKFKLVARLKSDADSLSTKDMIILANRCFNALIELEDDYTSFHSDIEKLIAQHQEVEFAAKDKESWNDWDIKARYMQQVQCLSHVEVKLSSAQDKLTAAYAKVDALNKKKLDLLRILTKELYEEEERVKILTAARDQFQKSHSDIKDGIGKLEAEKAEASVAFKAIDAQYNAAKKEFEKMSDRLLQLVKYRGKVIV